MFPHSSSDNASSTVLGSFPNETLMAIFLDLSPATLTSLARVCRRWRAVAEWFLYTNIFISDTFSPASPFPFNTSMCCQTLISHPHLATGLRKLHIQWISNPWEDYHYPDRRLAIALLRLSSAISLSANLESLDLHLGFPPYEELSGLPSCFPSGDTVFHSLRYLSLSTVGYFPHDQLLQLLRNMPSMQDLRVPDYCDRQLPLRPHTIPSLTSFCGSPRVAAMVLPGRPVQSLTLIGQDDVSEPDLSRMTRTSVPLRHLDLSAILVSPRLLQDVSRKLSMVESLKVTFTLLYPGI